MRVRFTYHGPRDVPVPVPLPVNVHAPGPAPDAVCVCVLLFFGIWVRGLFLLLRGVLWPSTTPANAVRAWPWSRLAAGSMRADSSTAAREISPAGSARTA